MLRLVSTVPLRMARWARPESTLYVGNLPYTVDEDAIKKLFPAGQVKLVRDRETSQSRGHAYVTFPEDAEAQAAIAATNGHTIDGRPIRVDLARPRAERPPNARFSGGSGGGGYGDGGGAGFRPGPPRDSSYQRRDRGAGGGGSGWQSRGSQEAASAFNPEKTKRFNPEKYVKEKAAHSHPDEDGFEPFPEPTKTVRSPSKGKKRSDRRPKADADA